MYEKTRASGITAIDLFVLLLSAATNLVFLKLLKNDVHNDWILITSKDEEHKINANG